MKIEEDKKHCSCCEHEHDEMKYKHLSHEEGDECECQTEKDDCHCNDDDDDCGDGHCHCHDKDDDDCHCHTHHDDGLHCSCGCDDEDDEEGALKKIVSSALFFVLALVLEYSPLLKAFDLSYQVIRSSYIVLYLLSYLTVGRGVITGAIKHISKGRVFDEQFLMSIASIGAVAIGEYAEGVAVMLFYMVGEYFQDYAVDKSRKSISALMDIRPDHASVIREGKVVTVSPKDVLIGEVIEVKPGERVALDGVVIEGESFADTSALTGESVPRHICADSKVMAGFVNTQGVIKVRVTKLYGDSEVTRILKLTQKASSVKAKSEKFVTKFAKIYTPIVCYAALAVALIPSIILMLFYPELYAKYGFTTWLYRALTFLVVSCPCALVISIPLSFFSGIGRESREGILVKGSTYIEELAKVKSCVFDKTGTLTKGVFAVQKIVTKGSLSENELIALASHGEKYSNHPISKSIKASHNDECCKTVLVENAQEISGHGISVSVDGKAVLLGNSKFMIQNNVRNFTEYETEQEDIAGTVIYVALEGSYEGCIVIADEIKSDSKEGLSVLKKLGLSKCVMLTGDSANVAQKIGKALNIDQVYADLLPEGKVNKIEQIINEQMGKGSVMFVGDGINDSPVLARADVGVAMGALGSDAAIEASDVVIMTDEISRIATAIKIARRTMNVVYQNIWISIGIKILIMILSALGLANMWLAVFGDVGVTFIAIINALRLL